MTTAYSNAQEYLPAHTEKALQVQYDPETDILTLWNEIPASNGSTIAQDLMVFFDEDDEAQSVTLEGAAKLLRPYLFPGEG